jgi:microcystin-dependent protein
MPKTRRKYKGNATATTVSAGLSSGATSCVIGAATGWPTSGPFYMVIDPGLSTEEKILVGSISGTTISSLTRGVDDTTDQNHAAGCTVYPVFTAVDADEANELTSTYANQGGIVYQGASTFAQLAIGTASQVLKVNSGATAPEWGQVATAGIADSAVTSAKIADGTIVLADLAAALQAFLVPVGTIAMYGGSTAPTGWLLCDGTSTTGYSTLAGIVGATTPDLRGRFAIGDNASLTLLGTGGSTTIAEGNLPSHTHTFSATSGAMSANSTLSHSITDSGHTHTINGEVATRGLDGPNYDAGVLYDDLGSTAYTESTASNTTGISIASHDVSHTHSVSGTTGSTGSGTAYYQPYLVVNYIIKHD